MHYSTYNNNSNSRNSVSHARFCNHDDNKAWEYKLKINDRKIYQCSRCGSIKEMPLKATLKLPSKGKKNN